MLEDNTFMYFSCQASDNIQIQKVKERKKNMFVMELFCKCFFWADVAGCHCK